MKNVIMKNAFEKCKELVSTFLLIVISLSVYAQDVNAGINQANTQVRSYFDSGTNLM